MSIQIMLMSLALLLSIPVGFLLLMFWFVVLAPFLSFPRRVELPDLPAALDFVGDNLPWDWDYLEAA